MCEKGTIARLCSLLAPLAVLAVFVAICESGAQEPPQSAAEVIRASRIFLDRGKPDSALTLINDALATDSTDFMLFFIAAAALQAKKRPDQAREALEKGLRMQAWLVETDLNIAADQYAANRLDSAAYYAASALRTSDRRSPEALYWLGRIHEKAGRLDSALFYYRAALGSLPNEGIF